MYWSMWGFPVLGLLMMVFGVLVLVGLVVLIIWGVTRASGGVGGGGRDGDSALRILQERYARGELSHDDYHRMRDTLSQGPSR